MELTGIETFRYTNPFPEEIPAEGTYKVYNNVSNLDIKTILTAPARPAFVFPKRVWDEVQYSTKQSPTSEFALFLITKQFTQRAPKYMALDIYFPQQEADSGGVSIDTDDCEKFYELLSTHEAYKDHMHARIAHLHSHNNMGVFWSSADTNQQLSRDDLGYYDDFRFYLVVNTHDEVRCSFVVYKPLLRRFDNIPVVVIGTEEDTLTDERKAELDAYLEERVTHKVTTNVFANIKTFDGYETELPPPPAPVYTPYKFTPAPAKPSKFTWTERTLFEDDDESYKLPHSTDYSVYDLAAKQILAYARRVATQNWFTPDEAHQLRVELFQADMDGFLLELLEDDEDLEAIADVFDGDMEAAVNAYIWLGDNWDTRFVYRDILNEEVE